MSLLELYGHILEVIDGSFRELEDAAPKPEMVDVPSLGPVWRFRRRTIEGALIQKLARVATGLRASKVLLERGLTQEVAVLHRVLDELCEDILFLAMPLLGAERTRDHDRFIEYFYAEQFDQNGAVQTSPQVPRRKIQAYLARLEGIELNPSDAQSVRRSVTKTFSGFVHGASPHIMELYGGQPPRFHISGMRGTPRFDEYLESLQQYFFRGVQVFETVALALRARSTNRKLHELRKALETSMRVLPEPSEK